MTVKVVEMPAQDVRDIPGGLRRLADRVEAGELGEVNNLAWVIDSNTEPAVTCGMLGPSAEPGAVAHLMFAVAQRQLEGVNV